MLLVAPDPRQGIAPERVRRIRRLLEGLPTAPGVAVALPGGADGVLDALVLRPDGVLGLVPAGDRVPVPAAGPGGAGVGVGGGRGGGLRGGPPGGTGSAGGAQERAAAEIDRLLGLADPTPTAPRQVVPVVDRGAPDRDDPERTDEDTGIGVATAARLVLTASSGPIVLDAAEVRRLFGVWRLAEVLPGPAELAAAGFPDPGASARPATAPLGLPAAPDPVPEEPPRPGGVPDSGVPDGGVPGGGVPDGGVPGGGVPGGGVPGGGPDDGRSQRRRDRRSGASRPPRSLPTWVSTWRGLGVAALVAFGLALGVAVLVVRGTSRAPEEIAAEPVRVVDGLGWTQRVVATEPTCEGHSYGLAVQFLRERPCVALDRALWTADADGTPVVAAVAVVRMHDAASAAALKSLIDSSGTGNVADLLREGRGYPGAPTELTAAGYSATQLGESVVIAETDATDSSSPSGATLDRLARSALALR